MDRFDTAIVGSGPAGLSAAVNLSIRNKRFVLFGTAQVSRKLAAAPRIDNYLGLPAITGEELRRRFLDHLAAMNIEITQEQVQMVYPMGPYFSIVAGGYTCEASTVILALGTTTQKPFPGEEEFLGRGVGYCATCDAPLYRGKTVAVLGYTPEAAHEANYVAELAGAVYYIPMRPAAGRPAPPVRVLEGTVTGIAGEQNVHSLLLRDGPLPVDAVFILRETIAPASLVPGLTLSDGLIHVDAGMATNLPGCYAAGDCTGLPHQYMRAAGQGQTAALGAVAYLDKLQRN